MYKRQALLYDFDLLIMDEPFKGLDKETKIKVMDFVISKDVYKRQVLGAISILSSSLASVTNTSSYINVNILELMTFVGIMHMLEGILVMLSLIHI